MNGSKTERTNGCVLYSSATLMTVYRHWGCCKMRVWVREEGSDWHSPDLKYHQTTVWRRKSKMRCLKLPKKACPVSNSGPVNRNDNKFFFFPLFLFSTSNLAFLFYPFLTNQHLLNWNCINWNKFIQSSDKDHI